MTPRPDSLTERVDVPIAYRRLGVDRAAVALAPQITPQLRMIQKTIRRAGQPRVTRQQTIAHPDNSTERKAVSTTVTEAEAAPYGPGGDILTAWPLYLSGIDDDEIRALLAKRRSLPHVYARLLPIEAFCLAAGVSPLRVLELLVATIVRQGAQSATIIAAVSHPRVVQKTVEMALTDDGIEDRTTLHKATGFLPTPKGAQTTVNVSANARANSTAQAAAVAPPPEQTIRRLSDRFNEARLAPAQPVAALSEAISEAPPIDAAAVPAAPAERFGESPARFAVPSRITAPAAASAERIPDPPEEEEDEL